MRVSWTRPAARDLEEIGDYIARENPAAAARTIERIRDRVRNLSGFPHSGRRGRAPGTRELDIPSTPFIVGYRVDRDRIDILAVFHGARRWPDSF